MGIEERRDNFNLHESIEDMAFLWENVTWSGQKAEDHFEVSNKNRWRDGGTTSEDRLKGLDRILD